MTKPPSAEPRLTALSWVNAARINQKTGDPRPLHRMIRSAFAQDHPETMAAAMTLTHLSAELLDQLVQAHVELALIDARDRGISAENIDLDVLADDVCQKIAERLIRAYNERAEGTGADGPEP